MATIRGATMRLQYDGIDLTGHVADVEVDPLGTWLESLEPASMTVSGYWDDGRALTGLTSQEITIPWSALDPESIERLLAWVYAGRLARLSRMHSAYRHRSRRRRSQ